MSSENAVLFERLMEIHSNPPILYYGFNNRPHYKKVPLHNNSIGLQAYMIQTFSGKLTYWSVWFVEKCMHNYGRNSNINILEFMSMPQNHQQLSTLYTKA